MIKGFRPLVWLIFFLSLFSCNYYGEKGSSPQSLSKLDSTSADIHQNIPPPDETEFLSQEEEVDTSLLELSLIQQGLVDISTLNPDIVTDIKYSGENNFLGEDVYEDFDRCYLLSDVAERLSRVQETIMENHPRIRLLVFDCVRPRSVQKKMWEMVKGTDQQKYVAYPGGSGSMHNYGAAVDLGLVHLDSGVVDMGTAFDFFGDLAQPRYEEAFEKEGKLSKEQIKNRRILRAAMLQHGFHGILTEWWHFNGYPREEVKVKYQIVE